MSRSGQAPDDAGERRDTGGPRGGEPRDLGGRPDRRWPARADDDDGGRPRAAPIVEVHGSDVQAGPEMTDEPRAGATEPPD